MAVVAVEIRFRSIAQIRFGYPMPKHMVGCLAVLKTLRSMVRFNENGYDLDRTAIFNDIE